MRGSHPVPRPLLFEAKPSTTVAFAESETDERQATAAPMVLHAKQQQLAQPRPATRQSMTMQHRRLLWPSLFIFTSCQPNTTQQKFPTSSADPTAQPSQTNHRPSGLACVARLSRPCIVPVYISIYLPYLSAHTFLVHLLSSGRTQRLGVEAPRQHALTCSAVTKRISPLPLL